MKNKIKDKFPPIHPGEILQENFFKPRNLTIEQVANSLHIPSYQLEDLVQGKGRIDLDLAYRLGVYFKVGTEGFLNLQQYYDLEVWKDRQEQEVKRQIQPYHEERTKANL